MPEEKGIEVIESETELTELFSKEQTLQFGGYSPLPRIIRQAKGLSLAAKTVYALLVDYYWNSGEQPIKKLQKKMCHDLGDIALNTLHKYLEELKTYGLLDWERKGMPARNVYTLNAYPETIIKSYASQLRNKIPQQVAEQDSQQDSATRFAISCETNNKVFKDQSLFSKDPLSPLNPPKSAIELIDYICDMLPKIAKPLSYLEESGITQIFLKHGGALAVEFAAKTKSIHGKYGSYENLEALIKEWEDNGKSFERIGIQTKNGNGGSGWHRPRPRKKYLMDEDKGKSWREKEGEKMWDETKRKYRDGELPPLEHPEGVVLSDEARKNWDWSLDDEIN